MVTVRFQEITRSRKLSLRCLGCSKSMTRTVTVMNTVNPFNRDENGIVRSPQQVHECVLKQLEQEAQIVIARGVRCRACIAAQGAEEGKR
jgi:hypothetical protein